MRPARSASWTPPRAPSAFRLTRLGDYGLFYQPESSESPGYNGFFEDDVDQVGAEQLVVRTFEAEPGRYAYVTLQSRRDGTKDVDTSAPCYPFQLK